MALQQLHTLDFRPDARILKLAAQHLSSAMPALRRMSLHAFDTFRTKKQQWPHITQQLCQLQLQELALSLDSTGPRLADLLPLTCLTGLKLDLYHLFPEDAFCQCRAAETSSDLAALGKMTQLSKLHLCRGCCSMADASNPAFMRRLAPLPLLTSLMVKDTPMTNALLAAVVEIASPWPALQRLAVFVASRQGSETEDLVRAIGGLPSLKQLSLLLNQDFGRGADSEDLACGADDDAEVGDAAEARLRCIAGEMGFAISISHQTADRSFPHLVEL